MSKKSLLGNDDDDDVVGGTEYGGQMQQQHEMLRGRSIPAFPAPIHHQQSYPTREPKDVMDRSGSSSNLDDKRISLESDSRDDADRYMPDKLSLASSLSTRFSQEVCV